MMDIYPTIVEAIGGQVTPGRFAKSLLPVAEGKKASVRDLAISEIGKTAPLGIMARDGALQVLGGRKGRISFRPPERPAGNAQPRRRAGTSRDAEPDA